MGIEGSSEKPPRGPRLNFLMELTDLPLNGSVQVLVQAGRRLSRLSLATNRTVTFSTEESRFLSTSL